MNTDEKQRTPMRWRAADEVVARTIAAIKSVPGNIWEEFKAVEVNVGHLIDFEIRVMSDVGKTIVSIIQGANPDLDLLQRGILLLQIRTIVRQEVVLRDRITF